MNKIVNKTNGKKTEFVLLLGLAFELLCVKYPDLLSPEATKMIGVTINSSVFATLTHRIWRNRKEIGNYVGDKYKGLKTRLKALLKKNKIKR